ncbi:hypothetical protein [Streptomyces sp. NPDC001774]
MIFRDRKNKAGRMPRAGKKAVTSLFTLGVAAAAAGTLGTGVASASSAPAIAYDFPIYNASQDYTLSLRSVDAMQTPLSCGGWVGPPPAHSNDPAYYQPDAKIEPKTQKETHVWLVAASCNKVHTKYDIRDKNGNFAGNLDTTMYLAPLGQSSTECRTDTGTCLANPDWTGAGQAPKQIVFS